MADLIKESIIQVSRLQLLGAESFKNTSEENIEGLTHLEDFLSYRKTLTLCAYLLNDKKLEFIKTIPLCPYEKTIIFSKKSPFNADNQDFLKLLQINTICGSPTTDLYEFLNKVISPIIQKDYDKTIKKKVLTLQSTLKSVILTENVNYAIGQENVDLSLLEYTTSIQDELKYWEILSQNKSTKREADAYIKLLLPIANSFNNIELLPIIEIEDLLERCHNVLDDLWRLKPSFPKERIKHLINLIGDELWTHTVKQFKECNIWSDEYNKVSDILYQSIAVGEKWLTSCHQLTGLFWPNYSENPWTEDVYQSPELVQRISLLKNVISIRTIHKQLLRLSTPEEQNDLENEKLFKPFKDIDILNYDENDLNDILKAQKEFEYLLQPAEERVALKIKKQLIAVNSNTRQLINEFTRYSELISRPVLKRNLQAERQFLLSSLHEYVSQIRNETHLETARLSIKQEASETIKEIILLRQLEAKADEVIFVTKKLLDDLDRYESLIDFVMSVKNELKTQHTELFESWTSDVIADINNNSLSLKEVDPVIQFYRDKLMKVNYSSRLITLISEVRQLRAMGYHIPSLIQETSDHAKKFLKYARTLEQIANFHNTIGDRMIPCQKPMMLASALELSKLVQEQEVVSWREEKSVEKYVDTLKKTVEKLSRSNNLLTSCHMELLSKIQELEQTSLIKDLDKWNETIKSIKNTVSNIEHKGYKNLQAWRIEIDVKICEVLEKEYVENFNILQIGLDEIRVDLVYRNFILDFSPKKETLEQMYEQQLKNYLNIPKMFKGVSNTPDIYLKIIERNQHVLENISKEKEKLFAQLDTVKKHWQSWLQLEELDSKKLTSWQHWDLHFRASKTFGQEIAKLPNSEEKVGCFIIGLSRFRLDLESHNRSYWDQLVDSLKDSIAEDIVKLQNYIDPSTAALTKQPVTIEEIGETGFNYTSIVGTHTDMEVIFTEMLQKSQTLASWSREQIDSVNRLKGAWERLSSLINNHQHIMAKQLETVRTSLNIEKENLLKEIERFEAKWTQTHANYSSLDSNNLTIEGVYKMFEEIKCKRSEWDSVLEKRDRLLSNYTRFNMDVPDIVIVTEIENALNEEESSWSAIKDFISEFKKIGDEYWIVFRKNIYNLENFISTWENKLNQNDKQTAFVEVILEELKKYKDIMPLLKYVKGEDFSDKHWSDLFNILKMTPKAVDQLLVKDFLDEYKNILDAAKELQELHKRASGEILIRQTLKDIDQWGFQTKFVVYSHVDSSGKSIMLIKEFREIINAVGDHQILLQSLKNSTSLDSFIEITNNWESKLEDLTEYVNSLAQIQKRWLYLEPIFVSGTLPQENIKFDRLDRDYRKIMLYITNNTRVTELCKFPNLKSILHNILDQLSRCQNSLNTFLKGKRDIFPRFLFINDDDLLEIIGQSSKEQVIQSQLKKLFAGIHCVQLNGNGDNIVAICSLQGEVVHLENSIAIKRPVEEWLEDLVKEMKFTLKALLVECQREKQAPDPLKYPAQILCLSNNISFTIKCEQSISSVGLTTLLAKYKAQLSELSSLELTATVGNTKSNESAVLELKQKSLVLDTIHHIRVLQELINANVTNVSSWVWQKQLRYYSNAVGDVTVKMAKARMEYSYEYLGNYQNLVRTPLVERCFLTLTQAMHLGLGGNPYGPAGTGKTESVKALGSILGRQVLVFNCDEGIDANSMERILIGLAKTGAWGCFDEFNRLDETTLSAVSMNIQSIQEAIKNNSNITKLANQEVSVNKNCGVFVTLNPAGGGYGGRNKLPDNLKQLFRPVVMTHPDHEEIARTYLYCDGYQYAEIIAKKIVEVFEMSSKLMSKQQHYDWGLRAIKTVVSSCQSAIKRFKLSNPKSSDLSMQEELNIIVNCLQTDIVSKLTFFDTFKFNEILENTFSNTKAENMENEQLRKAVLECYNELNLVVNDRQVNKCLEFYNQLKQRMGVAIIGPPCSGKSTIIDIVSKALTKMHQKIKTYLVNPKCMARQVLLGYTDHLDQWNNGVLTNYGLQVAAEVEDVWSWIICDGDIDPEWIESLNSVLDDNRLMTLPSGWRIHFGPNVNFVFETHDVKNASPATISRIGIVYLSSEDVNVTDFLTKKLNSMPEDVRNNLEPLFRSLFLPGIDWITKDGEVTLDRSAIAVAMNGFSQVMDVKNKLHFIVALINGLGQQLDRDFRELFAKEVFEWADESTPSFVLSLYYDQENDAIGIYHTSPNLEVDNIENGIPLIKTGQVLKYLDILATFLTEQNTEHLLLVGPHGSAKRLMVNYILYKRSDVEVVTINCSPNITTNFIIHQIQQNCISISTFQENILKPKRGKIVLYLRNLHLLKSDVWGSNTTIEFLRQLIEYKGFYNSKAEFVRVQNVTIIGTLLPTHKISSRFLSKMHLINIDLPEREDLSVITIAYLSAIIKKTFPTISFPKTKVGKLAMSMIAILEKAKQMFSSLQQNNTALSPHDLIRWCTNLKYYSVEFDTPKTDLGVLEVVCYEAIKLFTDTFARVDEQKQFNNMINEIFRTSWETNNLIENVLNLYFIPKFDSSSRKAILEKYLKNDWQNFINNEVVRISKHHQNMNVIVNDELLLLISAIMRVAAIPEYNMVLLGKSGVGRKTALKIASALLSVRIVHPSSGNDPLFHNDLKLAIQYTGVECEDVFLILEDNIFSIEQNSNLLNLIITSGEVPDLFTDIEIDSLIKGLREKWERENFDGDLNQFFSSNIRKHLHVFVCLDENNANLRNIILSCPALSQNGGLICLNKWSDNTIGMFPNKLVTLLSKNEDTECSSDFEYIYKCLPNTTPLRYISMVQLYCTIYKEKKKAIKTNISKLKGGVSKLTDAKNLVVELKKQADQQQEKLAEKQFKANAALDQISDTIKGANTHKEEMEVLKKKTEAENVQLVTRKSEIEKELAEVEPLIREASAAVGNIKTESLSEIRSLRAPPEIIRDILEGVLKLMGTQDTSWNSMKTFLAKRGIKEEIKSFDASRIQTENRQAVEKLIAAKKDSFDLKNAKRASIAAAPLAAWVEANVKYSRVLDKIKPLEREQHKLLKNLDNAQSQLVELNVSLSDVDATVVKLKEQLSLYTKEAAEIEVDLKQARQTLVAAEGLVFKLEDEYKRWQEQLQELSTELEILPKKCLLGAAFITFLLEEEENERRDMITKWCQKLNMQTFDFILFFSTEREQLQWESEGLSKNKNSLENAIAIKKGSLTPLLIDPTSTAIQWLKEDLSKAHQNFDFINYNSPKFNTVLEASIRFGKTLLVEGSKEALHALLPLYRKEITYEGDREMVCVLGRKIEYNLDFKIIMCSRNEHLLLPAEVAPYLTTLNFNVTYSGFTEQLLSAAITQEKPELESRKKQLLQENEVLQEKMETLQNQLLECLANSDENILNNKSLLTTLNDTKTSYIAVSDALNESKKIQNELRKEYEVFLDISSFGSQLYIACREFSKYDILYSLSANSFRKLFLLCINTIQLQDKSIESPKRQLFQSAYNFMSRGMFKNDRLPFFFHLVYRNFSEFIPEKELNIFLNIVLHQKNKEDGVSSLPSWLPPASISQMNFLNAYLPDLVVKCQLNERHIWTKFMESSQCEQEFPTECKLSDFQKVLVTKALRPDRLITAIEKCVLKISGLRTIDPPVLSLQHTFNESSAMEPILLITTSGMDPSTEIRDLAKQLKNEYEEMSMGEGQEAKALHSLKDCGKNGKWLILKNLQLVTHWLPVLFQNINNPELSTNFRLWLISESTQNFNAVLAQNCLKIAYEEPQGVGNNMERIYGSLGDKYDNKTSRTSARIFFIFSCLHALLQERRNYIPQGWTKYYEFNHTDIQTSLTLTEDLWNIDSTRVQWEFLKGLLNEAVYSGRIEISEDIGILEAYLQIYFRDEALSYKWKPLGLNINLSNIIQNKDYVNVIKQFPKKDQPSMFGLPENIDKSREKQTSLKLLSNLKGFYQKQSTEIEKQETNLKDLHPYFSMWKKINEGRDFIRSTATASKEFAGNSAIERFVHEEYVLGISLIQDVHKCFTALNKMSKGAMEPDDEYIGLARYLLQYKSAVQQLRKSSIERFIHEEYVLGIRVIQDFHKCFTALNKMSKGAMEQDDEYIGLARYILQYKTPPQWLATWNGPKDPTQYLQELLQITSNLSMWKTKFGDMIKQPIQLSLFFYPETFLASFKQDHARITSTSLDKLVIRTSWNFINDAVVLSDLLIEGALYERKTIVQCKADSDSINLVPNCYFYCTNKETLNNEDFIEFPLYKNSSRECKITSLQVECNVSEKQQWTLCGLAFYLKY